MRRRPKTAKQRKKSSQANEARVAKDHGGRRTDRSGAGHHKGDGRAHGKFRIENKETDSLSYRFHIDEWLSHVKVAHQAGEIPVYHIILTDRLGRRHELAVTRYQDHLGLIRSAEATDSGESSCGGIGIGLNDWED